MRNPRIFSTYRIFSLRRSRIFSVHQLRIFSTTIAFHQKEKDWNQQTNQKMLQKRDWTISWFDFPSFPGPLLFVSIHRSVFQPHFCRHPVSNGSRIPCVVSHQTMTGIVGDRGNIQSVVWWIDVELIASQFERIDHKRCISLPRLFN